MRAEEFTERIVEVGGWQCRLTTYRVNGLYHCKADNVSPGAALGRSEGHSREEAEDKALRRAQELLGRTRRHEI